MVVRALEYLAALAVACISVNAQGMELDASKDSLEIGEQVEVQLLADFTDMDSLSAVLGFEDSVLRFVSGVPTSGFDAITNCSVDDTILCQETGDPTDLVYLDYSLITLESGTNAPLLSLVFAAVGNGRADLSIVDGALYDLDNAPELFSTSVSIIVGGTVLPPVLVAWILGGLFAIAGFCLFWMLSKRVPDRRFGGGHRH